jgi:hypothetical protein
VSITWTEVSRHRRTTLTVTVAGTPEWELPNCVVRPEYATFWFDNDEVRAVGVEGLVISGKDSRSGARMATTWHLDTAPPWLRDLAREIG